MIIQISRFVKKHSLIKTKKKQFPIDNTDKLRASLKKSQHVTHAERTDSETLLKYL